MVSTFCGDGFLECVSDEAVSFGNVIVRPAIPILDFDSISESGMSLAVTMRAPLIPGSSFGLRLSTSALESTRGAGRSSALRAFNRSGVAVLCHESGLTKYHSPP